MAMRLEDEDDRISNLARLFFHELSKKGKPITYIAYLCILGWDCLLTFVSKALANNLISFHCRKQSCI